MTKHAQNALKRKGRGKGTGKVQRFTKALNAITDHPDYIALSKQTRAFLWDFARQYDGFNNGNLSASPGTMGKHGWSKWELLRARNEAEEKGWIQVTRYPRAKKQPTLYKLSWLQTDDWDGKPILDPGAEKLSVRKLS